MPQAFRAPTIASITLMMVASVLTVLSQTPAEAAARNPRFLHSIIAFGGGIPGNMAEHQLSDDRSRVVFLQTTRRRPHNARGYLRNVRTGKTVEVTRGASGRRPIYVGSIGFAPDERSVIFVSYGRNLITGRRASLELAYVRHLRSGRLVMIGASADGRFPNGNVLSPVISNDMKTVAFMSDATNLVPGDTNRVTDIFLQDLETMEITRISRSFRGGDTNDECYGVDMSADARRVVFECAASNVVRRDSNGQPDIFMLHRPSGEVTRVSTTTSGRQANDWSMGPRILDNGRRIAFSTYATNLVGGRRNDLKTVVKNLRTDRYRKATVGDQFFLTPDFRRMLHPLVVGVNQQLFIQDLDGSNRRMLSQNRSGEASNRGAFFLGYTRDSDHVMFVSNSTNLGHRVSGRKWNVYLRPV